MKILVFTRYSRLGASSRVRLLQYLPDLEKAGIHCDVFPLLNDAYLEALYSGKKPGRWNLLRRYFEGFRVVARARRYDRVVLEKEFFPFLPAIAEWWLNFRGVPYIVDYDDAIFHNYDLHPSWWVRRVLGGKIASVMRRAETVVCGNEYLAGYARRSGARQVVVIPTVVDAGKYTPAAAHLEGEVVVGWIGSPSSVRYVRTLLPVLKYLTAKYPVRLHLVGAGEGIGLDGREDVIAWSESLEADLVSAFDIGIMPLEDTPWERGKCGYKLIQYMGCALPVVGSPVGVNDALIEEGINGFKAMGLKEWEAALESLIRDAGLRREMGIRGRALMEARYSLRVAAPRWVGLLLSVGL